MYTVCISRHGVWFQTFAHAWNVVVSANHSRVIAHKCVVSYSMGR